jgi:hypothetical protein
MHLHQNSCENSFEKLLLSIVQFHVILSKRDNFNYQNETPHVSQESSPNTGNGHNLQV